MTEMVRLSFDLPQDEYLAFLQAANEEGVCVTCIMRRILRDHILEKNPSIRKGDEV